MTVCGIQHADGVCVLGKCPHFKRCCPVAWDKSKPQEITNEEWLRQASTEELAEWITELSELCTIHHQCELCDGWCDEKKVMEWLKEIHDEM